jgi:hypothetical protein
MPLITADGIVHIRFKYTGRLLSPVPQSYTVDFPTLLSLCLAGREQHKEHVHQIQDTK